uniref:Nifu-like protein mitochondrial-like n=1 Tax=Tetraselmis sp. GSL018 TaxID=582737 RepID=A0A061SJI6_9CHLO|mmetsp:Transcript_22712/g.54370  ORF Transcript_22712/g.54370 Transcript_22712/m.54370 type:complete len:298 (+) Transcript_22712:93-986(+)
MRLPAFGIVSRGLSLEGVALSASVSQLTAASQTFGQTLQSDAWDQPCSTSQEVKRSGFPSTRRYWSRAKNHGKASLLPRVAVLQGRQERGMFVQTLETPNPASLMFLPGQTVMESGAADFSNAREAMSSPLAKRLFAIEGVKGVFYGSDFITITKDDQSDWAEIKPHAFAAIMDHYTSGEPLIAEDAESDNAIHEDDSEVVAMIKELLETRIRPAVAEDGGDIAFKSFDPDTGIVMLKMKGACSGCPSSSVTLKSGVENMLMHYIPEVKQVVEDESLDEAEAEGLSEFQKLESKLST